MSFITKSNLVISAAASWSYGLVFLLTIYEVFMRYFLHAPTVWSLELSLMVVGIGYTLGGVHATAMRSHLRIDVVYRVCSPRIQRVFDLIASLIAIGFLVAVVWAGTGQALTAFEYNERSGSAWNSFLPMVQKSLIPTAALLMLLQEFVNLIGRITRTTEVTNGDQV